MTHKYVVAHHSLFNGNILQYRIDAKDELDAMRIVARQAGWQIGEEADPNDVCPDDTFAAIIID